MIHEIGSCLLRAERRSRAISENRGGQIWNFNSHHRYRTPERRKILDSIPQVMNLYFMSELTTVTVSRKGQALLPLKWRKTFGLESGGPCDARELNDGKGSLLLIPRPKARRGAKGLLAHLREQTVSFPRVRRHQLPSK
jgi:bifunctional DNA-binding transcriptional regulator/antitoxin component of YhaV-PrlF toxin-antitoxin module